jgi:hypothetical protein
MQIAKCCCHELSIQELFMQLVGGGSDESVLPNIDVVSISHLWPGELLIQSSIGALQLPCSFHCQSSSVLRQRTHVLIDLECAELHM